MKSYKTSRYLRENISTKFLFLNSGTAVVFLFYNSYKQFSKFSKFSKFFLRCSSFVYLFKLLNTWATKPATQTLFVFTSNILSRYIKKTKFLGAVAERRELNLYLRIARLKLYNLTLLHFLLQNIKVSNISLAKYCDTSIKL